MNTRATVAVADEVRKPLPKDGAPCDRRLLAIGHRPVRGSVQNHIMVVHRCNNSDRLLRLSSPSSKAPTTAPRPEESAALPKGLLAQSAATTSASPMTTSWHQRRLSRLRPNRRPLGRKGDARPELPFVLPPGTLRKRSSGRLLLIDRPAALPPCWVGGCPGPIGRLETLGRTGARFRDDRQAEPGTMGRAQRPPPHLHRRYLSSAVVIHNYH